MEISLEWDAVGICDYSNIRINELRVQTKWPMVIAVARFASRLGVGRKCSTPRSAPGTSRGFFMGISLGGQATLGKRSSAALMSSSG